MAADDIWLELEALLQSYYPRLPAELAAYFERIRLKYMENGSKNEGLDMPRCYAAFAAHEMNWFTRTGAFPAAVPAFQASGLREALTEFIDSALRRFFTSEEALNPKAFLAAVWLHHWMLVVHEEWTKISASYQAIRPRLTNPERAFLFFNSVYFAWKNLGLWYEIVAEFNASCYDTNAKCLLAILHMDREYLPRFARPLAWSGDCAEFINEIFVYLGRHRHLDKEWVARDYEIKNMRNLLAAACETLYHSVDLYDDLEVREPIKLKPYLQGRMADVARQAVKLQPERVVELLTNYLEKAKDDPQAKFEKWFFSYEGLEHLIKYLHGTRAEALTEDLVQAQASPSCSALFALSLMPDTAVTMDPFTLAKQRPHGAGVDLPPGEVRLVCLRRWGSDSTYFDMSKDVLGNVGGGYFLFVGTGKGVVIDPGLDYFRLFLSRTPYSYSDIAYYLVSHEHQDHAGDLERMIAMGHDLIGRYNLADATGRPVYQPVPPACLIGAPALNGPLNTLPWSKAHCQSDTEMAGYFELISKLPFLKHEEMADCFDPLLKFPLLEHEIFSPGRLSVTGQDCAQKRSKTPRTCDSDHCAYIDNFKYFQRVIIASPDKHNSDLLAANKCDWMEVRAFPTHHNNFGLTDYASQKNYFAAGFDITIKPAPGASYRIVYTGDGGAPSIKPPREAGLIDVLIANLGSVKIDELFSKGRGSGQHLGLTALIHLANNLEPKLLIVGEILRSLSVFDWRTELIGVLRERLKPGIKFFISEIGLTFVLRPDGILTECSCHAFGQPLQSITEAGLKQTKEKYRFDKSQPLRLVCNNCPPFLRDRL